MEQFEELVFMYANRCQQDVTLRSLSEELCTTGPSTFADLGHLEGRRFPTEQNDNTDVEHGFEALISASEPSISSCAKSAIDQETSTGIPSSASNGPPTPKDRSRRPDKSLFEATDTMSRCLPSWKNVSQSKTGTTQDTKPKISYIAMIIKAIQSVSDKKMFLCDIYEYIMNNYPCFNKEEKAWRNNVRHTLSFNQCFVKTGRRMGSKGYYWTIHPACIDEFSNGDYRRRQARKRLRRVMKTAEQSGKQITATATRANRTGSTCTSVDNSFSKTIIVNKPTRRRYHPYVDHSVTSKRMTGLPTPSSYRRDVVEQHQLTAGRDRQNYGDNSMVTGVCPMTQYTAQTRDPAYNYTYHLPTLPNDYQMEASVYKTPFYIEQAYRSLYSLTEESLVNQSTDIGRA